VKNSNDTVGNRSCDLPVCSAVPQPLRHRVPPHLSHGTEGKTNDRFTTWLYLDCVQSPVVCNMSGFSYQTCQPSASRTLAPYRHMLIIYAFHQLSTVYVVSHLEGNVTRLAGTKKRVVLICKSSQVTVLKVFTSDCGVISWELWNTTPFDTMREVTA
jgi:hypothetical protein